MKGPSLQKTTALSAALHLSVLILAILFMRQSNQIIMPSPYVVSLVGPVNLPRGSSEEAPQSAAKAAEPAPPRKVIAEKPPKEDKSSQKKVEDRISELVAKKRVERIVQMRSIISLKGSGEQQGKKGQPQNTGAGRSGGTISDSYYAKITREIWQEWIYPDTGSRNLEAVVFVKILKDGSVTVQGIEKSSGNILFDRSALKAIAKASPVSSPPYEMEIGIRFYP